MKLEFSLYILKNTQISNFVQIHPVGDQPFHAMDGQTNVMKLRVTFPNFANAPINLSLLHNPSLNLQFSQ